MSSLPTHPLAARRCSGTRMADGPAGLPMSYGSLQTGAVVLTRDNRVPRAAW